MYIHSLCCISPSGLMTDSLDHLKPLSGNKLLCQEPDYKNLIAPMQLRRMSKTLRTGVAAAKICLREAGMEKPDAIHIGTAYGVLDDSEKFLNSLITQNEQTLTPTAFIQSTHNTVSGQIALATGCHAHNLTFVHNAHSFESALLDASLFLQSHSEAVVLAGAVEECTPTAFDILQRFGIYDQNIPAGEGAAFFTLSQHGNKPGLIGKIIAFDMFVAENDAMVSDYFQSFLNRNHLKIDKNDLMVSGAFQNETPPEVYRQLESVFFTDNPVSIFKGYCGEYPTASAFGLAYAALSLKGDYPGIWLINNFGKNWVVYYLKTLAG